MKICSKCKIEKELDEFSKYFHSKQNKERIRGYCKSCFSQQQKIVKQNLKNKKKIQPVEDLTPIITIPIEVPNYLNNPDYKKCNTCQEWKLVDEFHYHSKVTGIRFTTCKVCQKIKDNEIYQRELEERGGNDRIKVKPNDYQDKYQKEQTFMVMEVLGYTYNEDCGVWTKPGVKELIDGNIVFPKVKKKRKLGVYDSRITYDILNKIIQLKERGLSYDKIGDKLGIASTTAFKHYTKWQNKSK